MSDQKVMVNVEGSDLAPYPREMAVHEIFAWCARRAPNALAVLSGEDSVTYGELDQRSNQLAHRLAKLGVKRGSIVGLLTNRSIETIICWLATLKCGAAYLPFDSLSPSDAIKVLVQDCQPTVVLGERDLIAQDSSLESMMLTLEDELAKADCESIDRANETVSPMDAAYLMYTSGTTGKPKGVIVPHRGIVRLVRDQNYMNFGPDEVFLFVSALAFDAATWEVWGALLNGGSVGVVSGSRVSIDQIARAISDYNVTTTFLTAGLFHAIVDHDLTALLGVRQLLVGGDVMSPEHVMKAQAALPDCQLINGYGPTEATTFCVCYQIPREGWGGGSVPIGTPIAHTAAYILDEQMRPVAAGEVGLLWTSGDGVSLGYLDRPELTAERFRQDPFRNDGSVMYLTGDLVRYRADGAIEFVGRNDRQVKIDGKRIELDEIELNLRRDTRLSDAIVVLRKTSDDTKKIAAFFKPAAQTATLGLIDDVLDDLRKRLPPHMIPHEATLINEFPLTKNGKVDRAALLDMQARQVESVSDLTIDDDLEKTLAEIWSRVLDLPQVDPRRTLFDLGGTSLQVMRIHAEVRDRTGANISITDLFANPRIVDLAHFLRGRGLGAAGLSAAASRGAIQAAQLRKVQRNVRKPTR